MNRKDRKDRRDNVIACSIGIFLFAMFCLPFVMLIVGIFLKGDK